jgi:hypothetical protein
MTFKLIKKSSTAALAKFQVLNAAGDIVGSVNVPPSQVDDLLRCWTGTAPAAKDAAKPSPRSAWRLRS